MSETPAPADVASTVPAPGVNRWLFVLTILSGSFLLFLVQPMVARMALPQLGGAPNVWNSAMLVYQALLLGGYAYAHMLGRMLLKRAAGLHLALLVLAALTLPITLFRMPPSPPGWEVLWVPMLFVATIGPVFFLVSAQAPLMQRWFALHPAAGQPWALYAASNLGSFAGLLAYPLVAEPLLSIHAQSIGWSIGYGVLIALIGLTAWSRWNWTQSESALQAIEAGAEKVGWQRILMWLGLSAVPSGLMLSTTTHLTTDIFAMPLLWVIPLGLYLLSFAVAFSDRRALAGTITLAAPAVLLLAGGMAAISHSGGTMMMALASVVLLFVVAVVLHAKLYDLRPAPEQLTLFYLVMSAGGALGGVFTALIAPVAFDWVWEHPLLVVAAALLMPLIPLRDLRTMPGVEPGMARIAAYALFFAAAGLCWFLLDYATQTNPPITRLYFLTGVVLIGLVLVPWRPLFVGVLAMLMLAQGGMETIYGTTEGARTRSYFGIYTVRNYDEQQYRSLAHGTTLHGQQSTDPALRCRPTSYYGEQSGAGLALAQAQKLYGNAARIGVVGLGTGTLASYYRPGERWRYYEIDPAMLDLSRDGTFTYLTGCAKDVDVVLGDARIKLAETPPASFDVLAVDAFSSDAIPLHLLTTEAMGVYLKALSPRGILVVHISNRYIGLEPVLAAAGRKHGLAAMLREDNPADPTQTASSWVVLARDPEVLKSLSAARPDAPLRKLAPPAPRAWTDDHASILPYIKWAHLIGTP